MTLKTYKNGRVHYGTFSETIDGVQYPTARAIALLQEAFELERHFKTEVIDENMNFSGVTRWCISLKYGVSQNMMILGDLDLSARINGTVGASVNEMARAAAWLRFTN